MSEKRLTHIGKDGSPRMVDLSGKEETHRSAEAESFVRLGKETARVLVETGSLGKGNVTETARLAGIQAAKRTADLIPFCHPLRLDWVDVRAEIEEEGVRLFCVAVCRDRTGAEMEAMTGAAVAALTVYDMCKSAGKGIEIESVRLLRKEGGKSGRWERG